MTDKMNEIKSNLESYKTERGKYVSQYTEIENSIKNLSSTRETVLLNIQKLNGAIEALEPIVKELSTDNPELDGGVGG